MGLIGAWHASLFFGFPLVLLSPLQFLAHPAAWLEAIASNAGTLSAAPNFAYQSCVDRIRDDELDGLDLSTWIEPTGDGFIGEVDLGRRARQSVAALSLQAETDR